MSNNLLFHTT